MVIRGKDDLTHLSGFNSVEKIYEREAEIIEELREMVKKAGVKWERPDRET